MLDARNLGNSSSLAKAMTVSDQVMQVAGGMGSLFNVTSPSYFYATIRQGAYMERVKVISRAGDKLAVQRGQDGTSARVWPVGACITVEWNPAQLCEFVGSCVNGTASDSTVVPGKYCVNACTCLTVDGAGRITKIDQGGGCGSN